MVVNKFYVSSVIKWKIKVVYVSEPLLFLLDHIEAKSIPQAQKYITGESMA